MRRALSLALLSVLSGLGACSGSDHPSNTPSGGTAGSAASSNTAGRGGEAAAPSAGSGGGGTDASAGSDDEGGSTAGTFTDAGAAGTTPGGSGGMTGEGGSPELGSSGAAGVCSAVSASYELSAGVHVAACTPIDYSTNPPSSGEHYPSWADFGAYDFPLPRGYWVHNLEHGAVVVSYNCPDGCDDDVERAKAWLAQLTADATCSTGPARVLLVPDPLLDVPWAASAWGFTLCAECFDADAFSSFVDEHVGQPTAPEYTLCNIGVDFRADGTETCGAK